MAGRIARLAAIVALALSGNVALADDTAPVPATDATPAAPATLPTPAPVIPPAPSGPIVTMQTSMGTITIALDAVHAPVTVANFVRYAREKHFDGTVFYRVEPGFVIQAGSYDAAGKYKGGQHKPIALEANNGLLNKRGAIAMARDEPPASADAEYFINLADNPSLNPAPGDTANKTGYAVFGMVTGGLDVVDAIGATPTHGGKGPFPDAAPVTPVVIQKVTIVNAP
jgi:cyclophilin family peptidyl-prolyl cis-trans isomerase